MITYSYLRLRQEIPRYEYEGQVKPYWWLYGRAWRDFNHDSHINIVIPFNYIIASLRWLWHFLLRPKLSLTKIEKIQHDAYYAGVNSKRNWS